MRATLLIVLLLSGCRNACQQLCTDIRDYASESCGLTFSDAQIDACIDDHSRGGMRAALEAEGSDLRASDNLATCREWGATLQEEWTCEDLEIYFDATAQSAGDTAGG